MSDEPKPEPGDVWEFEGHGHVLSHEFIIEADETRVLCSERTGVSRQRRLEEFRQGRWCTNVFDLLAGDPSAWAAALRFAPEVFLLEVGEGEEKREVVGLPKGCDINAVEWFDPSLVADDSVTHFRAVATGLDMNGERHWNVHVNGVEFGLLSRYGKTFEEAARTGRFAVNAALKGDAHGE